MKSLNSNPDILPENHFPDYLSSLEGKQRSQSALDVAEKQQSNNESERQTPAVLATEEKKQRVHMNLI